MSEGAEDSDIVISVAVVVAGHGGVARASQVDIILSIDDPQAISVDGYFIHAITVVVAGDGDVA